MAALSAGARPPMMEQAHLQQLLVTKNQADELRNLDGQVELTQLWKACAQGSNGT
jgi:hypothetical protein